MIKKPINVLIVDDSRVAQELLAHILTSDPDINVVGFTKSGEETLAWLERQSADVITMDVIMPGMSGLEVTRKIMATNPIPIVIVSAAYRPSDEKQAFNAIEAGALAILEKPSLLEPEAYELQAIELLGVIKTISEVRLVKRRGAVPQPQKIGATYEAPKPLPTSVAAVGIGASLGGPLALSAILSGLDASFPAPIFIVQHIAAGFTAGFVKWLQGFTRLKVSLAQDGDHPLPGHCYVAPAKSHMEIGRDQIIHLRHSDEDLLQPAVGKLFRSMAEVYGSHAIGLILTGMGRDGAEELLLMRNKGASTIAQDKASCVMFGMPKEAIALGAVDRILPLDQIANALIELTRSNQEVTPHPVHGPHA